MRTAEALRTWSTLNAALKHCDEEYAKKLLKAEQAGLRRSSHLLRIHARINRLRTNRERKALVQRTSTRRR